MMTNKDIFQIAMQQSAYDLNCSPEDFTKTNHMIMGGRIGDKAKKYYKEPIGCNLVSYGSNIVAYVKPEYQAVVEEYIHKYEFYHCFETPNLHWLDERLSTQGQKVCFMAEYFLPDMTRLERISGEWELKVLESADFRDLYTSEWSNALSADRKELDILGVGAYEDGKLIGLAACSADCDKMWQIGVDVLPQYRNRGVAKILVSNLAVEILERDKVPFYCCAWSNLRSVKTAIKCGFMPAWVEMTIKPKEIIDDMNR